MKQVAFDDEHITIGEAGFDPENGILRLEINEKHESVGVYYITVRRDSNNRTRVDSDVGNPGRVKNPTLQTSERNDSVKEIKRYVFGTDIPLEIKRGRILSDQALLGRLKAWKAPA